MTTNSLSTCCESGGRTLADSGPAASAQAPVYCPVYESRLLATARHELNSAAALGVYGGPYGGSQGYGNYVTYGSEASAFYSLVRVKRVYRQPSLARHAPSPRFANFAFPNSRGRGVRPLDPGLWGWEKLPSTLRLQVWSLGAPPAPPPSHPTPVGTTWQVRRRI